MKKLVAIGLISSVVGFASESNIDVAFPDGYKEWKHVKTMIIKPEHPMGKLFHGIHHIYANDKAYDGYKKGKFKDGSVVVLDFLKYTDKGGSITESDRIYAAVMVKDKKKYSKTHGWGYEAFGGNSRKKLVKDVYSMCVQCHEAQEKNDYIFSAIRK